MQRYKILVFGSTGSGKTSLCNALSPDYKMPVSDSAVGVTFSTHVFPPIAAGRTRQLVLVDTIGLNEGDKGTVSHTKSTENLVRLIKESKDGYNLLIHVMQGPRITKTHVENYELFVQKICGGKIPCVLVVTRCENSSPMQSWVKSNRDSFTCQGLTYQQIIASCFAAGGPLEAAYAPLRKESAKVVAKAINACSLKEPLALYTDDQGFIAVLRRTWNWLCEVMGSPKLKIVVHEGVYQLLLRFGLPPSIARALAKGI